MAQTITLNDRYELGDELGRGGMGVVYRAHDTVLDRDVAVKVLNQTGLGTEGRARLLSEAQAVAKLNHPNIVTVHDAGEIEGTPYIVMELVEGESLYKHPPDGFEGMISMAKDVSAALEHAHSHEIIHRDLKPENIVIAPDGMAKLMDFGLARSMATRVSVEGEIIGTVFYIAPETAMGQDIDGRADLYSLGVILYEQAAGELPFVHEDPLAVVSQHLHATVLPPRAKNPEIPPVLEELILQLLSKDPDDRPESAAALLKLLDNPDLLDPDAETEKELSVIARIARGRFVAREGELEQAKTVWSKAAGGRGQTLLISGEPGIGKTRLVRELTTHVELSGGKALIGECYSEGGAPYAPFAQIIRTGLRGSSQNGFAVPDFVMDDLLTMAPELRPYYSEVEPNPPLEPDAEQQRLFENVVSFCNELAEHSPVMIVIDDAHWGDSGSLSMLRHLARRTRNQRILLVATYREVDLDVARPFHEILLDINKARLATRLKLERMTKEQTRDLLAAILEDEITQEFLDGIYKETEGNPFFVEEVCKTLVEEGKLYYADGEWHRPSMDELEIPQSVRVAIQTRVARLPEPHQNVLSMAAILGREFEYEVLAEASEADEDSVIEALEAAEDAQLIEETGEADEDRFAFVHALIPLALLDSVRKLRRRKLHRRAAAAVEKLRSDDYEALAHHYSEAGDDQRALTYYMQAGQRAAGAFANREAEGHFRSALDLVEDRQQELEISELLVNVLYRHARYDQALEIGRRAIEICSELDKTETEAHLYALSTRIAWDAGDTRRSLAIGKSGLEAVGDAPDSPGLAELLHETARANFFNGFSEAGVPQVERALEVAIRTGAVEFQIEALITQGSFAGLSTEQSKMVMDRAVDLARSEGFPDQEGRALNNRAILYGFALGDLTGAFDDLKRAANLARERHRFAFEFFYGANAGGWGLLLGELSWAEKYQSKLKALLEEVDDTGFGGRNIQSTGAILDDRMGRLDSAMEAFRDLLQFSLDAGDANFIYSSAVYMAEVVLHAGTNLEEAESALDAILSMELHYAGTVLPLCRQSQIHAMQGRLEEANKRLNEAHSVAKELDWAIDKVWLAVAEASLAVAEGRWEKALGAFEEADTLHTQHGMRWDRAYHRALWADALSQSNIDGWLSQAKNLLAQSEAEFREIDAEFYADWANGKLAAVETINR